MRKYVPANLAQMSTDAVNSFIDLEERQVAKLKEDEEAQRTLRRYSAVEKGFDEVTDVLKFEAKLAAMRLSDAMANAVVIAKNAARLADAKAHSALISAKRAQLHENKQAELALRQRTRPIVIKISPPQPAKKPATPCYYGKDGRRHSLLFDHSVSQF